MSFAFKSIDHVQLAAPKGSEIIAKHFFGEILGFQEVEKPEVLKKEAEYGFNLAIIKFILVLKSHSHPLKKPTQHFKSRT